jgi:hypothetical protein
LRTVMTSTNFEMENYHLMEEEQILILMPFFSLEMIFYKKSREVCLSSCLV